MPQSRITGTRFRALTLGVALTAVSLVGGCDWLRLDPPVSREIPDGDVVRGRQLLIDYACVTCHVIPGVPGTDGHIGPPLTNWARRGYIAGRLPNEPDNLIRWIENPQAIDPGNLMPVLGVSEEEARDMAAYLYTIE
jgi:cytochrome c